jgi:hypothetical protein
MFLLNCKQSQKGSILYENKFWMAEIDPFFEPPRLKVAQHSANCSKMSTLAQKFQFGSKKKIEPFPYKFFT